MKVGLIGMGRFGGLIARYLSQDVTLLIYDRIDKSAEIRASRSTPATLFEVCQCPIILAFTPISELERLLISIKDIIRPDALLIDGCSVKEYPIELMKRYLQPSVSLLGAHPMFGPDSAQHTLMGAKVALCPVRIDPAILANLIAYLEGHGIKVIVATPQEHDKQISHSLILTHFIGRAMLALSMGSLDIDTKGHRRLIKILETVRNDSIQLFEDMNRHNRFAGEMRKKFIKALTQIDQSLSE